MHLNYNYIDELTLNFISCQVCHRRTTNFISCQVRHRRILLITLVYTHTMVKVSIKLSTKDDRFDKSLENIYNYKLILRA